MRFLDRTVLVTGGSGGLGSAVCAAFAEEGAAVAVLDADEAALESVAARLPRSVGLAVDVREPAAVREGVARVHSELGGPHIVVALAGGSLGTPRDTADIEPEHLDLVLDVNVKGSFYVAQAALPYMVSDGGGSMVLTSSIGGRQPSPVTGVPYAASKAALAGMTRRLAKEYGPASVRVNAIAPGLFLTGRLQGMFDALSETEQREVLDAIPLRRMPDVCEAVEPILFLASEAASYITGVVLDVNGGRFMPL